METVKFSFERSAAPASTNKDKSLFQSIAGIATPDADTVVITMKNPEPNREQSYPRTVTLQAGAESAQANRVTQPTAC